MINRNVRGVKGFTLIELLAVMAIVAVLAGIVAVAVAGTGGTSKDTQVVEDGNSASSSLADFFSDQSGAEFLDTKGDPVLGITITSGSTGQEVSSLWPEVFLTTTYATEFPTDTSNIASVIMLDADGNQERAGGVLDLVHNFTALNFTALSTGGYATDIPESFTSVSTGNTGSTDTKFHNYLWLLEKTTTASTGSSLTNSRNVAIYKLLTVTEVTVDTAVKYALTFQRLS